MNYEHAGRSVQEVLGLPDLPGLTALPGGQDAKVPFIEQRIALNTLLKNTLEEKTYYKARKAADTGNPTPEILEVLSKYKPTPNLVEWASVEAYFDTVAKNVPQQERAEFDKQREWARYASENGKLPEGVGRLDLDRPERQLLWAATIVHAFGNDTMSEQEFSRHPIVKAVTHSRFVDRMYNQLAYRLPAECKMVLGHPGSWFYFRPDPSQPLVNLDLCHSLIGGGGRYNEQGGYLGHFEPIAHHEIGHAKFSRFYPESMQDLWKRMATLGAKGGMEIPEAFMPDGWKTPTFPDNSEVSPEEYKEFLALEAEFKIRHSFWNACEDNCVNRYSVNLGDPDHIVDPAQRHMGNLADSQNVFRTIIEAESPAKYFHEHGALAERKEVTAGGQLSNLQHAVNMAFYIRNRLAPDTQQGRASIGINDTLLPGATDAEHKQTWEDIKTITKRIEELQPHALDTPGRRYDVKDIDTGDIQNVNFDGKAKLYNQWRNKEIEKLLHMADPYIEKEMEEVRQKIDQKVKDIKDKKPGANNGSGPGMRVKGLEGAPTNGIPSGTPGNESGRDKDAREGESAGSRRKREENGEAPKEDGPQKREVPKNTNNQSKPKNNIDMGKPSGGAGNQASALDRVELGDGRSYHELRHDPIYGRAVIEAANQLREMSERVTRRITEIRPARYELPTGGNVIPRLDRGRLRNLQEHLERGKIHLDDIRVVRREEITSKPVTHDIVVVLDGSGSMGHGKGSRMEIAMKTAALMYDSIRKLHQQDPENTRYRLFISLWGDTEDWSKNKEAPTKYLIAEPGMKDKDIEARIERVLQGIASGTQLAPAFTNMLGRMKRHSLPAGHKHGMTHFIVPTDGEIFDTEASRMRMEGILKAMPNATIDTLITANKASNELRSLMAQLKTRYHGRVNVTDTDWESVPSKVVDMLRTRQRTGAETLEPISDEEHQSQLSAALRTRGASKTV